MAGFLFFRFRGWLTRIERRGDPDGYCVNDGQGESRGKRDVMLQFLGSLSLAKLGAFGHEDVPVFQARKIDALPFGHGSRVATQTQ